MTVTFTGLAQLNTWLILKNSRSKSDVEFAVGGPLLDRIFPPERQNSVIAKGVADLALVEHIPPSEVEISGPEAALLTRVLTEFHDNGPGITFESGKWYYPLMKALKEEGK